METKLTMVVTCPYCGNVPEREARYEFHGLELEVDCSNCNKTFLVEVYDLPTYISKKE